VNIQTGIEPILREIEAREGEIVALTQDLIRFPTVNPPGEAKSDALIICDLARKRTTGAVGRLSHSA